MDIIKNTKDMSNRFDQTLETLKMFSNDIYNIEKLGYMADKKTVLKMILFFNAKVSPQINELGNIVSELERLADLVRFYQSE